MIILRTAGKAIAALVPASQLVRLGLPGLWSVEALALLTLAGVAWVVIDAGRAKNLALILSSSRSPSATVPSPPGPEAEPGQHLVGRSSVNGG